MVILSMGTSVTIDMKKKFALITAVMCLYVKKDILDYVVGSKNMVDVNLHNFVSLNI